MSALTAPGPGSLEEAVALRLFYIKRGMDRIRTWLEEGVPLEHSVAVYRPLLHGIGFEWVRCQTESLSSACYNGVS